MNTIKLNFINNSSDMNNSSVVIYQKNEASDHGQIVAWKVIENCGRLCNHPFEFPIGICAGASDSYGNYTPLFPAEPGSAFEMIKDPSGNILKPAEHGNESSEVVISNHLIQGVIDARCYRDGRLLAVKTGLAPEQKALFEFSPKIYIGVVSQITEGQVMNAAILSEVCTEINLTGIMKADIVMTGGGPGKDAKPFAFELEHINS